MTFAPLTLRALGLTSALAALSACSGGQPGMLSDLDWDFRGGANTLDTTDAARQATAARPMPDANGLISYPGYQVAVARRGDTVGSVAARVGINPAELAGYNAIQPNAPLREGEVLALPRRVASTGAGPVVASGGVIGSGNVAAAPLPSSGGGAVSVTSIATTALDRVDGAAAPAASARPNDSALGAMAPTRHQVKRGETAFSIARMYNVSARALADWNGLGADLEVREGQYLMIPTPSGAPPEKPVEVVTAPGAGSPTPEPPSAAKPLPDEETKPAAQAAKDKPASPDLVQQRTAASAAQFAMPASGSIIRGYAPPKNEGIDIGAPAGAPVMAAAAGTVAAITQDTAQTPIIVIRHEGGLLTVYAGVAGITVKKGDKVTKGQTIANVRSGNPSFLHFEVRRGAASTDPMPFLK
ncbi:MAG: peptidoglycan DD-metalloendopeptidase family protein [Paracoccaceae bacterium]